MTPQQKRDAAAALVDVRPSQAPSPDFPDDGWIPQSGDVVGYALGSGPHRGELRPAMVIRPAEERDFPTARTPPALDELLRRRGLPPRRAEVARPWRGVLRLKLLLDTELDGLEDHVVWAAWSPEPRDLHWTPRAWRGVRYATWDVATEKGGPGEARALVEACEAATKDADRWPPRAHLTACSRCSRTFSDSFRLRRLMFFRTPEALKTLRDEAEARLAAIEAGTVAIAQLVFGAPTELTISAGGSVTTTRISHKIDTAGDAGSDDLDTLVGVGDGEFILLRPESAARDVVIRDTGGGTGNIRTPFGKSITLAELTDWALGIGDGTNVTILAFRTAAANGGGMGVIAGLLASLTTTDKATLVAAINEVNALAVAGIGAAKKTVTIGHADLTGAVNGAAQAINIGTALPANARVFAHEVNVGTLFSGGSASAVKLDVGGTDADAIVTQLDVFTGAATGALAGASGVHPDGSFASEQLVATFTPDGGHTLLALDAGALTITVWYFVLA